MKKIICRIRFSEISNDEHKRNLQKFNRLIDNAGGTILYEESKQLFLVNIDHEPAQDLLNSASSFVNILKILSDERLIDIKQDSFYYICHDIHIGRTGSGILIDKSIDFNRFKQILNNKFENIEIESIIFFQHQYNIDEIWTKVVDIIQNERYCELLEFIMHFCREQDSQEQKRIIYDIFLPLAIDIEITECSNLNTLEYFNHLKTQVNSYMSIEKWEILKEIKDDFNSGQLSHILKAISRRQFDEELINKLKKCKNFSNWLNDTIAKI